MLLLRSWQGALLLLLIIGAAQLSIKLDKSLPSLLSRATLCLEVKGKVVEEDTQHPEAVQSQGSTKSLLSQGGGETKPNNFNLPNLLSRAFNVTNTASDVAYLNHCRLDEVNAAEFSEWAAPFLAHEDPLLARKKYSSVQSRDIWEEETLQLLEVYASANGHCNFEHYKPTVSQRGEGTDKAAKILKAVPSSLPEKNGDSSKVARLAFVIVAYKDAEHLAELVRAIHMPHHLIVIHLEQRTSADYEREVRNIASNYSNVAVVKFGSIIYRSDMVTYVNLMIMRWMVEDLGLDYDYHVNLGAATFPLYNATTMAAVLKQSPPRVRLGTMISRRGAAICEAKANAFSLLSTRAVKRRKILNRDTMFVKGKKDKNVTHVFPRGQGNFSKFGLRPQLQQACTHKANSGDQAMFDIAAVRALLNSKDAMELFAHFKYACCCCVEESNWFAALTLIGRGQEAEQAGAMWQAWLEEVGVMNNAVISTNETVKYSVRDSGGGLFQDRRVVQGNDLRQELLEAKNRGHLFARKFDSNNAESVELRSLIEEAW